jgi:hypothetical protein
LEGELLICLTDRIYREGMSFFDNGFSVVKISNWGIKRVEKGLFPFKNY